MTLAEWIVYIVYFAHSSVGRKKKQCRITITYYLLVCKLLSILYIDNYQLKSVSRARTADGDAKYLLHYVLQSF